VNKHKRKGDAAELEVQGYLRDELGYPARRALGAGRADDIGDITGIPSTCVQVAAWADLDRAVREKLPDLERQQNRMGATFAGLFVRRRGGKYVVVMTPEQWTSMIREGLAPTEDTESGDPGPIATRRRGY
jgi:hypothetical protein